MRAEAVGPEASHMVRHDKARSSKRLEFTPDIRMKHVQNREEGIQAVRRSHGKEFRIETAA